MRYRLINQLPFCCVPACIQMVLDRRHLPVLDQEYIGECLGLVTPKRYKATFRNDHRKQQPTTGYGTRINRPEFSLDKFFSEHHYPLQMIHYPPNSISGHEVRELAQDDDVLVCVGNSKRGHVVILDGVVGKKATILDPTHSSAVKITIAQLEKSLRPEEYMGGYWHITTAQYSE